MSINNLEKMRKTRQIMLGDVPIGGGAPVSIQTMTNTHLEDLEGTLAQIERVQRLGCDIVRVAVPTAGSLGNFGIVCRRSPLPVVADIHFDHLLALGALEQGAAGIRVNPGNMRNLDYVREVARVAAKTGRVVRIGVNGGSLDPDVERQYGRTAEGLVASALKYVDLFESEGCHALKVSLKSSSVQTTVAACRLFAVKSDVPLHLGVTEAGVPSRGIIKSAIGIGALLLDGIGETIRVSLTCEPEEEVRAAKKILESCGLREDGLEIVSCPTCGRTKINLVPMAEAVEREVERLRAEGRVIHLKKVAVMGCEVNGPGEARDADVGIAGGNGRGILFKHGEKVRSMPEAELLDALLDEIRKAAY